MESTPAGVGIAALLICTADARPGRQAELRRFLTSLVGQSPYVRVLLVLRGEEPFDLPPSEVDVVLLRAPRPCGLSAARNIALAEAKARGLLEPGTVVGFPDDDCWYPAGLLEQINRRLSPKTVLCAAYGPSFDQLDRRRFPSGSRHVSVRGALRFTSSVTTFYPGPVVATVGLMDEAFGVGARYGSSEDVDYLLRARRAGAHIEYDGRLWVGHGYGGKTAAYYLGNVAVLRKHAFGGGTALLLLRRLAGGAVGAAIGRLDPATFRSACRLALRTHLRG